MMVLYVFRGNYDQIKKIRKKDLEVLKDVLTFPQREQIALHYFKSNNMKDMQEIRKVMSTFFFLEIFQEWCNSGDTNNVHFESDHAV